MDVCPICAGTLNKEFYHKKITYHCEKCGGYGMNLAAFRSICGDVNFANELWKKANFGNSQEGVNCYCCNKKMRKVELPFSENPIYLDICCYCQIIWFDRNELEGMPLKPEEIDTMPQKAKEIMAMHAVEQIEESARQAEAENPSGINYILGYLSLPVEHDAPICQRLPIVTYSLALICIGVFALTYTHARAIIPEWGFITSEWSRHYGATIITSQFLHSGVWHLLGNIYFLIVFGDNVEDILRPWRYLLLIASSALFSTLIHALLDSRSMIPAVGASGFISGIIACYVVAFPKVRLSLTLFTPRYYLSFSRRPWVHILIPAWGAFILWIILQCVGAYFIRKNIGGTAYFAHMGGALIGLAYGFIFRYINKKKYRVPLETGLSKKSIQF